MAGRVGSIIRCKLWYPAGREIFLPSLSEENGGSKMSKKKFFYSGTVVETERKA